MAEAKVLTEKELDMVEELAPYLEPARVADYLGVSRATFFNILKRQPEADRRYQKGKSLLVEKVGKKLVEQALSGDMTAAIFFLKTRGRWSEKAKTDINFDKLKPSEAISKVKQALADQSLTINDAQQLYDMISKEADILEKTEIQDRLARIEEALNVKSS